MNGSMVEAQVSDSFFDLDVRTVYNFIQRREARWMGRGTLWKTVKQVQEEPGRARKAEKGEG
jgi:hypothetical protein